MFEAAGSAIVHIVQWQVLLALLGGVIAGVLSGALPGGSVPTLVVLLGFAYGMDPFFALPLAIGMIATVPTGDTLPAVLLGMPGSTSGQATILDGHPMAKQGKAGIALSAAYLSSMLGGLAGAAFLFAVIPVARPVVNTFGSAEFFVLGLVAIAVVGVVSSGALLRGLIAGAFGLLIASIGYDNVTGTARLTLGTDYLWDGIHIIPVVIGLFALPEFFDMIMSDLPIARGARGTMMKEATSGRMEGMRLALKNWPLLLRSSALGVFVGVLPGIGGSLAQWLSYASARQTVRGGTQTFGTGDVRGVIAPESANNAVDGGQLVPTLFFGVPGSVGMAIFLGFLIILGLQPGPQLLNEHLDLTLTIVFALALSNVLATGLVLGFTPQLARIAFVPPNVLVPLVLAVLTMAAFQASFSILDLVVMLSFGALGFFMKTYGWPRPPIIISIVLGGIIEKYYGIASRTDGWAMFTRIPVIAIVLIAAGTAAYTLYMQRSVTRTKAAQDAEMAAREVAVTSGGRERVEFGRMGAGAGEPPPPQAGVRTTLTDRLRPSASGVFILLVGAFFAVALVSSWGWSRDAARLPQLVSTAGLALIGLYGLLHLAKPPKGKERSRILDIGRTASDATAEVLRQRGLKAVGTTIGFIGGIWLVGFHIAVPAYVFLYLKIFGRVHWWAAAIAGAVFIALLYGFFDRVVFVNWPEPVLGRILPPILKGQ